MSAQTTHETTVTIASIDLLSGALRSLDSAIVAERAGEKYVAAHLAAIRAAAALLAVHARPNKRRPTSVWNLLAANVPEMAEWAAYFAAGAGKRAAAEAGLGGAVMPREADDLVRDAHEFIDLVADRLGVSRQLVLPANVQAVTQAQRTVPNNVLQFKPRT
jgi:ABC-type phosphate/phosphonate transport system substrate-binding protein